MKMSNTVTKAGSRGTKIVKSTGRDDSSYGDTSAKSLDPSMKGNSYDASSSIAGAKVRK